MKKLFVLCLSIFLLFACSPTAEQIQKAIEQTQSAGINSPDTSGSIPSLVPQSTRTTEPSKTSHPTKTRTPLPTNTPAPKPIPLSGFGDNIVDFKKWDGPAIAIINYSGSHNFIVKSYDSSGSSVDLLVNTIGTYKGTVAIDFYSDEYSSRFEIKASGSWDIEILPLSSARTKSVPGTITGNSDDVVILTGKAPDLIKANSKGNSNFIVWSYSERNRDLVFNEIAPYSGTALLDSSTIVLTINAEGDWSLEITGR